MAPGSSTASMLASFELSAAISSAGLIPAMLASLRERGGGGGTARAARRRGAAAARGGTARCRPGARAGPRAALARAGPRAVLRTPGRADGVSCLSVIRGRRGTRRCPRRGTAGQRGFRAAVCEAALAAVAGLALGGCSPAVSADTTASHALTIAEARAVYASSLAASDAAASHGDAKLGLPVTADAQQAVVRAQYRALASAGTPVPRYSYRDPVFYVPATTPFAQWFVVVASRTPDGGGPAARTLLLFERSRPGGRWTLDGSAVLDRPLPAIAREPDGYAVPLFINDTSLLLPPDLVGATQAAVADEGPGNPAAALIAGGPGTTG